MNGATNLTEFVKAHTSTPPGMVFYHSIEAIHGDNSLLGYVSVIERAWDEMRLDGVLCLEGRPVLYLKEHGRPFHDSERIDLQKRFWNQGVANVFVLADSTSVYIYSGLAKPLKDQPDEEALVDTIKRVDYISQIQSFYNRLATGHYYEAHQEKFDPNKSVDSYLLNNLRALRNKLIESKELRIEDAHAFIGRMLFLCYLLDRGIYNIDKTDFPKQTGTEALRRNLENLRSHSDRIKYLYGDLFSNLKEKFNGNMFDQNLDSEKRLLRSSHIDYLIQFLGGHEIESGQHTLDFWAYDFRMIPIETISAIYQDFLSTEDRERQQTSGAIYTPRFLAEMVVDMAIGDTPEAFNWSFLDPACGSGIFLVILFNRLAKRWLLTQPRGIHYLTKVREFKKILSRQIRGVDIEETACRIACFSLYLAYLDFFDPPDIQDYIERTGEPLPKLLNYGSIPDRPKADIPVIHKANFLTGDVLSGEIFDCIIGNPPWVLRGSKQLAQRFMLKTPTVLRHNGVGCLLLPSKVLQNQTDVFQAKWLKQITLEKVLQLSDYRRLLFQGAIHPAMVVLFINKPPIIAEHRVEFTAPKFNRDGLRQGVIIVDPSARAWIPIANILTATESRTAPILWKRHLWGSPRDQKFLDFLQSLPSLRDHVDVLSELRRKKSKKTKRWVAGDGIKPLKQSKREDELDRSPKKLRWSLDTPFVETKSWNSDLVLLPEDTITLGERLQKEQYRTDVLYSQPPEELFCPPMVLFSRGFSKVTYCYFKVLFQHSLRSIKGPSEDAELLMFLSAYLRSNLARYFLFHTSASWGSERDQVDLDELLRVPFPLPGAESISPEAEQFVKQVARKINEFRDKLKDIHGKQKRSARDQGLFKEDDLDLHEYQGARRQRVAALQDELEPLFYRYFGLTEQEIVLIEDTIRIFEPSSTPTTWRSPSTVTLEPVEATSVDPYANQGLKVYADTLCSTLNDWAQKEGSSCRVSTEGATDDQTGLAIIKLSLKNKNENYQYKSFSGNFVGTLNRLHSHISRQQGRLKYERDILVFQGENIYIVRPNILLNWNRNTALNDAARIYGDIALLRNKNGN